MYSNRQKIYDLANEITNDILSTEFPERDNSVDLEYFIYDNINEIIYYYLGRELL